MLIDFVLWQLYHDLFIIHKAKEFNFGDLPVGLGVFPNTCQLIKLNILGSDVRTKTAGNLLFMHSTTPPCTENENETE